MASLFQQGYGENPPLEEKYDGFYSEAVSIAYLKSLYYGTPVKITDHLRIEGTVTSTDRQGNFYKTIVLQDDTGGISIKADITDYFKYYPRGMTVAVECMNLTLGSYGGTLQLGTASADISFETGYLPENLLAESLSVIADSYKDKQPATTYIKNLSATDINTLVKFEQVQFTPDQLGEKWSEEEQDTDRYLMDELGNIVAVRTSRFASFAEYLLPYGSGSLEGIVTYYNGQYQLTVNDYRYVDMQNPRF